MVVSLVQGRANIPCPHNYSSGVSRIVHTIFANLHCLYAKAVSRAVVVDMSPYSTVNHVQVSAFQRRLQSRACTEEIIRPGSFRHSDSTRAFPERLKLFVYVL